MEGILPEFENENTLRTYPFAAGCTTSDDTAQIIPIDVFVDAAIYPINPVGIVYLSEISEDGVFSISDDDGVIMTGSPIGNAIEFYDTSDFSRHVGTLLSYSDDVLAEFSGRGVNRTFTASQTAFASSCLFPVVSDGVQSVSVGDSGACTGNISFTNSSSDEIRVSSTTRTDGKQTLRFDVLPRPSVSEDGSIRRIICIVEGQTPFRIEKLSYNVILLWLNGIDKWSVCTAAHRENQYEMADTCNCSKKSTSDKELPEVSQLLEVFIPPDQSGSEGGIPDGADNAFYLVVPNITNYDNPLSLTLEDGSVSPKTDYIKTVANGIGQELAKGEMLDSVTSKGVVLQVPGLSGGSI